MNLSTITPIIITYNEEPNIRRVLEGVKWARRIVIVDSFSTDKTEEICRSYPNVDFSFNRFDNFSTQCNRALSLVETEWALSMDADYVLTRDFVDEVSSLQPCDSIDGYRCGFRFCVFGEPLRRDNTSRRTVLHRKSGAHYIEDGHQHRVVTKGDVEPLRSTILHDDRKPLKRWLRSQQEYTSIEAEKIVASSYTQLDFPDKLRKMVWVAPIAIFIQCLFVQRQFTSGRRGMHYTFQRTLVEILLAINILEVKLSRSSDRIVPSSGRSDPSNRD